MMQNVSSRSVIVLVLGTLMAATPKMAAGPTAAKTQ
jgi:hypothetical protein